MDTFLTLLFVCMATLLMFSGAPDIKVKGDELSPQFLRFAAVMYGLWILGIVLLGALGLLAWEL